jgi:hypothetical protein
VLDAARPTEYRARLQAALAFFAADSRFENITQVRLCFPKGVVFVRVGLSAIAESRRDCTLSHTNLSGQVLGA